MTQPDFRALCAELLWQIQLYTGQNPAASEMSSVEITGRLMDAMAATTAALATLATAPPEPPTDEELVTFLYLIDPEDELSPLAMVRAALERWGHG